VATYTQVLPAFAATPAGKFCPSCGQKRGVEFGEWLCGQVLRAVPHRQFVFSIPKILRRFFLHDRRHLVELSRLRQLGKRETAQAAGSGTHPHRAGAGDFFRGLQAQLGAAYLEGLRSLPLGLSAL